jgi:hypothetical protein
VSLTALAFALSSAAYLGFQATIRLLVYPQLAGVAAAEFVAYEQAHQRRVTVLVGPLFGALVLSSLAVLLRPPADVPRLLVIAAVLPTALLLITTAVGAVPQHRRLAAGFDPSAHRRLLVVDTLRLVAAAAGGVLGLLLVLA